nr:PREDICTED: endoplasmic reticulum membrane-associated RNA degradation protein [Latimeria chalumnae]|eukprot:XP_014349477.1 PREDICTED: endoplasmic reticulum membrane-associated RNA degradation protein [Latimeria chalumnae]
MSTSESVRSCLSPDVHYIVCKVGLEKEEYPGIESIVTQDGKVCWSSIASHLHYFKTEKWSLDCIKSVRLLGPVCKSVHFHLMSLTKEQFEKQYGIQFEWTNNKELLFEVFELLKNPETTGLALGLLKLTSCLERALGDVHLLMNRECPFLLRDLLASQELAMVFGEPVLDILQVFLGSPKSLNLRNILWHGFAAPLEIPPMYGSMLLLLTAGLGQLLKDHLLKTGSVLEHRPYFIFTNLKVLNIFPDLKDEVLPVAEDLLKNSNFVLKIMLPYWRDALIAFKQLRYADCVILLLPQLETGLRYVFTTVNNCPSRLLTAESSTLYTTFDEMLTKYLNNEEINQLPLKLGEPVMEILWDFLNHPEGPRVRDHLSHGELDFKVFPREVANHIVAFSLVLLCQFLREEHAFLKVLDCVQSLSRWDQLPLPSLDQIQDATGLVEPASSNTCSLLMTEVLSQLQFRLQLSQQNLGGTGIDISTKWSQSMEELWNNTHLSTLYCPRTILEVVSLLRKITSQCHLVSEHVISSADTRYEQWKSKSLRSRKRQNYYRMISCIKLLSPVLRGILLLTTVELLNVHTTCEKNSTDTTKYLKFLKAVLQYAENLATYSSPEKNKWDETIDLTEKTLLKIKAFYAKWLT